MCVVQIVVCVASIQPAHAFFIIFISFSILLVSRKKLSGEQGELPYPIHLASKFEGEKETWRRVRVG
jgi:hypothetical protein